MTEMSAASTFFTAWPFFHVRASLGSTDGSLPRALATNGDGKTGWLDTVRELTDDPVLLEGIHLATPSLSHAIDRIRAGEGDNLDPAALRRTGQAVMRYYLRYTSRPTPFGLFAGTCFGRFDTATKMSWDGPPRTRTRADLEWLLAQIESLQVMPQVLPLLSVTTNELVYGRGGRLLLDTPSSYGNRDGEDGRAQLSVRATPVVIAALRAASTAIPVPALVAVVQRQFPSAPRTAISTLICTLVEQDLLVTDLRPPMDGTDPLRHVLAKLSRCTDRSDSAGHTRAALAEVDHLRDGYDRVSPGAGAQPLETLITAARRLRESSSPMHVDTALAVTVVLNEEVKAEAERAMTVLWKLSPPRLGMRPLRALHAKFLEHYGLGRLVNVVDVLDDTVGMGAPAGYAWPASEAGEPDADIPSQQQIIRDVRLSRLLHTAIAEGAEEIELTDADISNLQLDDPDTSRLPASCELFCHLVAPDTSAIDDGQFRLVVSPNPGSHRAGASIARFAYLDPQHADMFAERVRAIPPVVPGAVSTDLSYLTRGARASNLADVPSFTAARFGIGLPDTESADRMRLADLAVGATLDQLYVVHVPTGALVDPVSHTMTSPSTQAPNIARFLFELGMEGRRLWEPWSWGQLSVHPVLPRVRYGRTILSPTTWKVDDLRAALLADHQRPGRSDAVTQWQARWKVPDRIMAVSADQRLTFDLANPSHRVVFVNEVERDDRVIVQEPPEASMNNGWFSDGTQARITEIVLPFTRPERIEVSPPLTPSPAVPRSGDRHLPGERWLFASLYGARGSQDEFLRTHLRPFIAQASGFDTWFFIRYSDDAGQHLRLRFKGESPALRNEVLAQLTDAVHTWQAQRLVGAMQLQEYDPEYERYGGAECAETIEQLFQADSHFALIATDLVARRRLDLRTVAAVSATDLALAFGGTPDEPEMAAASRWMSITGSRRELPRSYRKDPKKWQHLLEPAQDWLHVREVPGGDALVDALVPRRHHVQALGEQVRSMGKSCPTPNSRIIGSLFHMTCNRLLGGYPEVENETLGIARGAVQDNARREARR